MLIVRDLLVGPRRYSDLKQGLPKIPTNILASRLKELQAGGVVRRVAGARGVVYELTEYGQQLEPIVILLGRWGFQQMGEPDEGDIVTPASLTMALRTSFQAEAAASLPPTVYELHVGEIALRAEIEAGALRVHQLAPVRDASAPEGEADAVIVAGPGIRQVISGEVTPAEAIEREILAVPRGDATPLSRFATTFHIPPTPTPTPTVTRALGRS